MTNVLTAASAEIAQNTLKKNLCVLGVLCG
jgi:hypothetical protein